jgi:hypothetical protein
MPRAVAAASSTWSTPTETLDTTRSRGQASSSAASTRSVRRQSRPSLAAACAASSVGVGARRSGQVASSTRVARSARTPPGSARVAKMRGGCRRSVIEGLLAAAYRTGTA